MSAHTRPSGLIRRVAPAILGAAIVLLSHPAGAETVFVEAEDFVVSGDGWRPFSASGAQTRVASLGSAPRAWGRFVAQASCLQG